jgi:hypothetical protein
LNEKEKKEDTFNLMGETIAIALEKYSSIQDHPLIIGLTCIN